jgi:cytochrome c peroxidase
MQDAAHIRTIFSRMGFTDDTSMVALIGAHSLGGCHNASSGFFGNWTATPTVFNNRFFQLLAGDFNATYKSVSFTATQGPRTEFLNPAGLMMLPTDVALITDPLFNQSVQAFSTDQGRFFSAFTTAFQSLLELGVKDGLASAAVNTTIPGVTTGVSGSASGSVVGTSSSATATTQGFAVLALLINFIL